MDARKKAIFLNYILPKYFTNIYITPCLYATSSTAAVISLQFIQLIHKNYYACL